MEPKRSAGFVLFRETEEGRQYLLLHYPAGHWDLPKGHIEQGETPKIAAVRELEEETGITSIAIYGDFSETVSYEYEWKGKMVPKTVEFFLAKTPEETVRLSEEHTGYEWLDADAAMEKATFKNAKDLLKAAEKALETKN